MQVRWFRVGDAELKCVVRGEGDTVVVLPGLGRGASYNAKLCEGLAAAGYRTVTVNPRGAAGSKGAIRGLSIHDLAADVADVIEQLSCGPVVVLGVTFGQRVARCLACDHPNLVRALIMLAAGGKVRDGRQPRGGTGPGRFPRRSLRSQLSRFVRWRLGVGQQPKIWPDAVTAATNATKATPVDEWWSAGRANILLIQGLDDNVAPPENGRLLKAELGRRVQLVELAGADHRLVAKNLDRLLDVIVPWLADLS